MTTPDPFAPGYRLTDGNQLNDRVANPQWSSTPILTATAGGTVVTSAKIVETLTQITAASAPNAGVVIEQALPGRLLWIVNNSPNTVVVFAEGGSTIDGIPGDVGITMDAGAQVYFIAIDTNTWQSYLGVPNGFGTGFVNIVTNITALRAWNKTAANSPEIVALVYNNVAGDGGGLFYLDAADHVTPDNGTTVIVDLQGNRWKRELVAATYIANTPAGNIAATTVQGALNELDTEKVSYAALAASGGSALVGYTQGGAGAVVRTAQAKFRDSVSVKDFGAVGDGIADDTVAIQAALTAVGATGGIVFFPEGTYKFSAQLNISSNTTMLGSGINASKLSATNALVMANAAIYGVNASNVRIAHLSILGNVPVGVITGLGYGVSLLTGTRNIIEDLYISDTTQAGIWCGEQTYLTIRNNYLDNPGRNVGTDNHGIGIYSTGVVQTHDIKVLNNTVIRSYRKGITTYSPNVELYDLLIEGNTVIDAGLGAIYGGGNGVLIPHRNYTITNNFIRHGYVNIEISYTVNAVISNNTCDYTSDYHTGGPGYAGIAAQGLIASLISNNIVSDSDGPGLILLEADANSYVTITSNVVKNSNQASGGYGSLVISNSTYCSVSGNIVYDEAGKLFSGGGINESLTSDYNYITSNVIGALGVGAYQYNIYGTHTLCEAAMPGVALNVKSAMQVQHNILDITTLIPGFGTRYDNVPIPANTGVLNIEGAAAAYSITGFVIGGDYAGRQLTVVNNTSFDLTFNLNDVNSTVGNRFQLSTAPADLVVPTNCTANFVYSEIAGTGIWVNI